MFTCNVFSGKIQKKLYCYLQIKCTFLLVKFIPCAAAKVVGAVGRDVKVEWKGFLPCCFVFSKYGMQYLPATVETHVAYIPNRLGRIRQGSRMGNPLWFRRKLARLWASLFLLSGSAIFLAFSLPGERVSARVERRCRSSPVHLPKFSWRRRSRKGSRSKMACRSLFSALKNP